MTISRAHLSKMQDRGAWEDWGRLVKFLAHQLTCGRLSLALGAGVSTPFGLPNWTALIDRAFVRCGQSRPAGLSDPVAAEKLFDDCCSGDEVKFAELIRIELYDKVDLSMSALRERELLSAIVAMTMASNRGNVSRILTFNFDDLVERFLTYYGFFIESVLDVPAWGTRIDTRVYHIHGFLTGDQQANRGIVMTQRHFDRITGQEGNLWRSLMVDLFRTHTGIFIGLSGNDQNLSSALTQAQKQHVSLGCNDAFWGVRFCLSSDSMINFWEGRGVYCVKLANYDELPQKLFEICQVASSIWRSTLLTT